jgi:6-phosphogluconolactonase
MIRRFKNPDELSLAAAESLHQFGRETIKQKGNFSLVLSGGKTPLETYYKLARLSQNDFEFWKNTTIFFGDERWVSQDDEQNNYFRINWIFSQFPAILQKNIFPLTTDIEDWNESAKRYESLFPNRPDLILLGMGVEGHIASIFPNSQAFDEKKRKFIPVTVPAIPAERITITPSTIQHIQHQIVLVTGKEKSEAVRKTFCETGSPIEIPARMVKNADWYIDDSAASLL